MKNGSFIENPIFICGHRRSGTTLFTCLLENHPDLSVYPPDSGFFYAFYPIYDDPKYSDQEKIEKIVNFCIKNFDDFLIESFPKSIRKEINFSMNEFRDEFQRLACETKCTAKDLLASLIHAYKNTYGYPKKPKCWVEKTTSSEIYAAEVLKWFPNTKFIHILRDPRDNWASLKSGWESRFKYHNDTIDRLMHSMIERGKFGFELAIKNQKRFGKEIYKVLKFEDLIGDTQSIMESVCDFIRVPFSKEVLLPTICGRIWQGNNYNNTIFKKPSNDNVGRWMDRITKDEAKLIEYHFEDLMKLFGYIPYFQPEERIDAAVKHYKWYNYAQNYSFTDTRNVNIPLKNTGAND